MFKVMITVALTLSATFAFATNVENVVNKFFYTKAQGEMTGSGKHFFHDDPYCEPRRPASRACIEYVCGKLGSFECDSQEEIARVARACAGGVDVSCVDNLCSRVSGFTCEREILRFTNSCKFRATSACIDAACTRMGRSNCDDANEVTQVAAACAGGSGVTECFNYTCSRLSRYECDDLNEVLNILRACR